MYKIVRFYKDNNHQDHNKVIKTGLTEAEAQEHCQREDTHERGVWFDGYTEEWLYLARQSASIKKSTAESYCSFVNNKNSFNPINWSGFFMSGIGGSGFFATA